MSGCLHRTRIGEASKEEEVLETLPVTTSQMVSGWGLWSYSSRMLTWERHAWGVKPALQARLGATATMRARGMCSSKDMCF